MKSFLSSLLCAPLLAASAVAQSPVDDTGRPLPPAAGVTAAGGAVSGVGCGSGMTTSHFLAGNGQAGNMFDIAVHGSDMTIECLDIHVSSVAGTVHSVEVFAVPGTCVGKDTGDLCAHGWVQIGTGTATSAGSGLPTNVVLTPVGSPYVFSANSTYGIYVTLIGSTSIRYTNGGPITYSGTHCDLTTRFGKSAYTPPCTLGSTFQPREFNGTLYTELAGPAIPTLAAVGPCPGVVQLTATHLTPHGRAFWLYGRAGSFTRTNPNEPCLGTTIDIGHPKGGWLRADANGVSTLQISAHANHCGTRVIQVVDEASCTPTNAITL